MLDDVRLWKSVDESRDHGEDGPGRGAQLTNRADGTGAFAT
jgi:hypothetical protein